jgi:hypothetical protein
MTREQSPGSGGELRLLSLAPLQQVKGILPGNQLGIMPA